MQVGDQDIRSEFSLALGQELKQARIMAGITTNKLPLLAGIDKSNLIRIEKGDTIPSAWTLTVLCEHIGISPGTVLKRASERLG